LPEEKGGVHMQPATLDRRNGDGGGGPMQQSDSPLIVLVHNGRPLANDVWREWLLDLEDGLTNNQVVARAEKELSIGRTNAVSLSKLYGIRDTIEFEQYIFEHHPQHQ